VASCPLCFPPLAYSPCCKADGSGCGCGQILTGPCL
jgi:hypothetical protein